LHPVIEPCSYKKHLACTLLRRKFVGVGLTKFPAFPNSAVSIKKSIASLRTCTHCKQFYHIHA
jgi:hypothetical protein